MLLYEKNIAENIISLAKVLDIEPIELLEVEPFIKSNVKRPCLWVVLHQNRSECVPVSTKTSMFFSKS